MAEAKPWLLGIVRNTCYMVARQRGAALEEFDDEHALRKPRSMIAHPTIGGIAGLEEAGATGRDRAVADPVPEVLILREFEELHANREDCRDSAGDRDVAPVAGARHAARRIAGRRKNT